jgi:putative transposase
MTNHVHAVAIPSSETALARAFGKAHNDYARWLNVSRAETGHFWQSRFFSCPLNEDHKWEALRYVELNPVRAGLVIAAEQWPWSSAAAHLGAPDAANLLDFSEWRLRWCPTIWRGVLSEGLTDAALLERIREATRTGRPAGSDTFVRGLEKCVGRRLRPNKRGPRPRVPPLSGQLELEIE